MAAHPPLNAEGQRYLLVTPLRGEVPAANDGQGPLLLAVIDPRLRHHLNFKIT